MMCSLSWSKSFPVTDIQLEGGRARSVQVNSGKPAIKYRKLPFVNQHTGPKKFSKHVTFRVRVQTIVILVAKNSRLRSNRLSHWVMEGRSESPAKKVSAPVFRPHNPKS